MRFHSTQPVPLLPSGALTRHIARGNCDTLPSEDSRRSGPKPTRVTPRLRPDEANDTPLEWIDTEYFNPGYLMRSMHLMPKRLDRPEWRHTQDYWAERDELPLVDLDDGCLVFE